MGYRTDQFYGIDTYGGEPSFGRGSANGGAATPADNGTFAYPSRVVRTNDHDGYQTTTLKRGYIRSLRTQVDGIPVDVKKCSFQFNPTTLEQSVTQEESLLNVFQSDPAQYAQPIPGNVALGFNLMFDRTMEVNNPSKGTSGNFNPNNPWELSDPSEVGVLKDLAALYACIGQGISTYQQDYLTALLKRQINLQNAVAEVPVDAATVTSKTATIPDFLKSNTGNVAFLLPVPVRVVFSSLYIVEGYVASTSVTFTKFSTQMVPIQCAVTVNMDAKYIGFAQKNTFLTYSLSQEQKLFADGQQQSVDSANNTSSVAAKAAPAIRVSLSPYGPGNGGSQPDTLYSLLFGPAVVISNQNTGEISSDNGRYLYESAAQGSDTSGMESSYDDGSVTSTTLSGSVLVFGPFTSSVVSGGLANQDAIASFITKNNPSPIASYSMSTTSSNKKEWKKMIASGGSSKISAIPFRTDDSATAYYVVKYRAVLTVQGTGPLIQGVGESYVVAVPGSSTFKLSYNVPLNWPHYTAGVSGTGPVVAPLVAPDNAASTVAHTTPGVTSRVGS